MIGGREELETPHHHDRGDPATQADTHHLRTPGPRAARTTRLTRLARREDTPNDDLDPYVGTDGHLVALRGSDLADPDVHSLFGAEHERLDGQPIADVEASETPLAATFPTLGHSRLFVASRPGRQVRTECFTSEVRR